MVTAAVFTIVKIEKQPKCPSVDEWIKKVSYIYIYIYMCVCVYACVCVSIYICVCVWVYTHIYIAHTYILGFLDGLAGKEATCNARDTGDTTRSLGREDPLEKEMATHSSILA